MTLLGIIGPWQLLLIISIPILFFVLGYFFGKKAGYVQRVRESESKQT